MMVDKVYRLILLVSMHLPFFEWTFFKNAFFVKLFYHQTAPDMIIITFWTYSPSLVVLTYSNLRVYICTLMKPKSICEIVKYKILKKETKPKFGLLMTMIKYQYVYQIMVHLLFWTLCKQHAMCYELIENKLFFINLHITSDNCRMFNLSSVVRSRVEYRFV